MSDVRIKAKQCKTLVPLHLFFFIIFFFIEFLVVSTVSAEGDCREEGYP